MWIRTQERLINTESGIIFHLEQNEESYGPTQGRIIYKLTLSDISGSILTMSGVPENILDSIETEICLGHPICDLEKLCKTKKGGNYRKE